MDCKKNVIDYVEGRMSFDEFISLALGDSVFEQWLDQNLGKYYTCHTKATPENNFSPKEIPYSFRHECEVTYFDCPPYGSIGCKVNLHSMMVRFLKLEYPDLSIIPDDTIEELDVLLLSTCPEYIGGKEVQQSGLIEKIVQECPEEWSKTKKVKHIRSRIREEFHLESRKYPRWIQNPEWPFSNGKPMKFVKTTVKRKREWYQHHFVDPETGEERIIDDVD